jgi:nickel transport protein
MPRNEVAEILGHTVSDAPDITAETPASPMAATTAALSASERQVIAQVVRDEIRPLRREIAAYKDHNNLQTILGGIGYIVGLFGLGFYLAARRKLAV